MGIAKLPSYYGGIKQQGGEIFLMKKFSPRLFQKLQIGSG